MILQKIGGNADLARLSAALYIRMAAPGADAETALEQGCRELGLVKSVDLETGRIDVCYPQPATQTQRGPRSKQLRKVLLSLQPNFALS